MRLFSDLPHPHFFFHKVTFKYYDWGQQCSRNYRNKKIYYGPSGNASLNYMFHGESRNISIEEIYGVDYNSSIYQFTILTGNQGDNRTTIIEVSLKSLTELDGSAINTSGLLGLSLLSSSSDLCATFYFLWTGGVKNYVLWLSLYAEPRNVVAMKGFMSLPNQARSFEKFELFSSPLLGLPENTVFRVDFLVTSLKFLQKRNTAAEPCVDVDNYDKVLYMHFFITLFLPCS